MSEIVRPSDGKGEVTHPIKYSLLPISSPPISRRSPSFEKIIIRGTRSKSHGHPVQARVVNKLKSGRDKSGVREEVDLM